MLKLQYVLFGALTLPIMAWAGDNSCLTQVRTQILSQAARVPGDLVTHSGISAAAWAAVPVSAEEFSRDMDQTPKQATTSLTYNFDLNQGTMLARGNFVLEQPQATSDAIFTLTKAFELFKGPMEVFETEEEIEYKADCTHKVIHSKKVTFTLQGQAQVRADRVYTELDHTPQRSTLTLDRTTLQNGNILDGDPTPEALRALPLFGGNSFLVLDDDDDGLSVETGTLSEAPVLQLMNPLTHIMEGMKGVSAAMPAANISIRTYESADGKYHYTGIYVGEELVSQSEDVSRASWLQLTLDKSNEDSQPKIVGFQKADFNASSLSYDITGAGTPPALFNQAQYFEAKLSTNGNDWKWSITNVANRPIPRAVLWNAPVAARDQIYLQGSHYIQLDKVNDLKQRVLSQVTSDMDRLTVSVDIISALTQRISYDHDAVDNGVVDNRTTEDILATGKGVCQHYAVVFVAIARSLGIPARIVAGLDLDEKSVGGHVWVEVELSDGVWWPLEPQVVGPTLPDRSYVPRREMREYEADADTTTGQLQVMGENFKEDRLWEGTTFTKASSGPCGWLGLCSSSL